jgi:hypothetical protein
MEKVENVPFYRPIILRQLESAVAKDFDKRKIKEIKLADWTNQKWNNIIKHNEQLYALSHCSITIKDLEEIIKNVANKKGIIIREA